MMAEEKRKKVEQTESINNSFSLPNIDNIKNKGPFIDGNLLEEDFFSLDEFIKGKEISRPNLFIEKLNYLRKISNITAPNSPISERLQKKYLKFHKNCFLEHPLIKMQFKDKVYAMDFSPCGNYLAVCAIDGTFIIYSIPGFQIKKSIKIRTEGIYCLKYSPDCRYIAFGGDDLKLIVVNAENLKHFYTFEGHTGCIQDIAWLQTESVQYIISVSMDRTTRIWNISTKKNDYIFFDHNADIHAVAVTQDLAYFLTSSVDSSINVYKTWTWNLECILKPHLGPIYSISASIDGLIASSSMDGTVSLYSKDDWRLIKTLMFRENIIKKVEWSPFGELLAICVFGQIYVISLSTFEIVITFREHSKQTLNCRWHPSGKYLVSSDQEDNLYIWKNPLYIIQGPIEDFKAFNVPDLTKLTEKDSEETLKFEYNSYLLFLEQSKKSIVEKFVEKLKKFKIKPELADRVLNFYRENVDQYYEYFKFDSFQKYEEILKELKNRNKKSQ